MNSPIFGCCRCAVACFSILATGCFKQSRRLRIQPVHPHLSARRHHAMTERRIQEPERFQRSNWTQHNLVIQSRNQRTTRRKQMGLVDVNGGIHTARKQHQRKNFRICAGVASRVLCGLGLSRQLKPLGCQS